MRKTFIVIGIIFIFAIIGVWLFLSNIDSVSKSAIDKNGTAITQVPVHIKHVSISPKTGEGVLEELTIGNPEGFQTPYAYSFANSSIKLHIQSLTTKLLVIHELNMQAPDINIEQNAKGNNIQIIQKNIQDYINNHPDHSANQNHFVIDSLTIQNAKLHVYAPAQPMVVIPMADIQLYNIGKEEGGVTSAQALNMVMQQVNYEIAKAIQSRGLENVIDISTFLPEGVAVGDRIKNFFNQMLDDNN